jgi:hypothetical protein
MRKDIMSCCGQKREQFHQGISAQIILEAGDAALDSGTKHRRGVVFFEYIGNTGLTVLGSMTGKRYRFGWHGAVVAVDRKDASLVARAPNLEQLKVV